MVNLIEELRKTAFKKSIDYTDDNFLIRGVWRIDLLFKPNINERTFNYTIVLAQTIGQGCCYCKHGETPAIEEYLMGKDMREVRAKDIYIEIAILDAVYSIFKRDPADSFVIEGSSIDKATQRTKIVVSEVLRLLKELDYSKGRKAKVINVGVVGNFIRSLRDANVEVFATDMQPDLVGRVLNDVRVEHQGKTLEYIKECDLALVTGMTLATKTVENIIETARNYGTKLVMFCETGANFGEEYCKYGVDTVVGEPFPFYIFQGKSTINIYRKQR